MSLTQLYVELLFDLVAILLGVVLVVRINDNLQRFYWGLISITIGIFFMWENINWVFLVMDKPNYEYLEILNYEKMLKWFATASIFSLFPFASLRPGYLNIKRLLIYYLPILIFLIISVCYLSSNPIITKISTLNDIVLNFNKFDIKLRLLIFIFSVLIPYAYFFYPLVSRKTFRKVSLHMYVFLAFNILLSIIYIFFTLFINAFFFNAFGILSVTFAITFSVLYLRFENPLSIHVGNSIDEVPSIANTPKTSLCFCEIDKYLKEQKVFVDSNYSIKELSNFLLINEQEIAKSIKIAGFTGFREYLNFLRLEHFKTLASQNPNKTIKELMFACGFKSRTTFYRVFSEQYGISPVKFISNLKVD
jgi:AraC-like DNA-binding protein